MWSFFVKGENTSEVVHKLGPGKILYLLSSRVTLFYVYGFQLYYLYRGIEDCSNEIFVGKGFWNKFLFQLMLCAFVYKIFKYLCYWRFLSFLCKELKFELHAFTLTLFCISCSDFMEDLKIGNWCVIYIHALQWCSGQVLQIGKNVYLGLC